MRNWVAGFWLVVSITLGTARAAELGPLWHEFLTVREPGERHEGLGPIYSSESHGTLQWWAFTPLMAEVRDPELGRVHFDFLYPLLTYDRFETESRWQLLQWLNFATGEAISPGTNNDTKLRRNFFPFIFSQKSGSGTNGYFAFVPFYGRMENHFFRDEIEFVAMPLWVVTRKRGVETINAPVPFFHLRHGAGVKGWQLWPLVGHETKEITWQTNTLDEVVLNPGHEKSFLLWPIGFSSHFGTGTTNPVTERMILPLFAISRAPGRDSTTVLWPFFNHTEDRQKHYEEWGAPWPFIVWADGEGKTARRVWPFFGTEKTPNRSREFVGWPLYMHRQVSKPAMVSDRWRSVFFLYDQSRDISQTTGVRADRRDLWPLFYWKRDFEGRERFQAFALFETFLKNNEPFERLYSPLWSLYRSEKNPGRGVASQSLLWNLWRRDVATNSVTTSTLFGLVRTKREAEARHWRFFWVPFAAQKSKDDNVAASVRNFGTASAYPRRCDFLYDFERRKTSRSLAAGNSAE